MAKATWNGVTIAESDDVVVVENNKYFPLTSVNQDLLRESATTTVCPWKGVAHYYSLDAGGTQNKDAAWYYPDPKPAAKEIKGRLAFWKGVKIS